MTTVATFDVEAGRSTTFVMSHGPSHLPSHACFDAAAALAATDEKWRAWSRECKYEAPWKDAVVGSLIVLKALTYEPTGGIVAARTTSLPEQLGGQRNWDYRYCWLRDATLTLMALMGGGYYAEAQAWRDWLHRSVAGNADELQIMYGVHGERRFLEWEADGLPGYQGAKPVRIGNAASQQLQLDVYGEVMDALHQARSSGLDVPTSAWALQVNMIEHLETIWRQPDEAYGKSEGENDNSCTRKSWRGSLSTGRCRISSDTNFPDPSNVGARFATPFTTTSAPTDLVRISTALHRVMTATSWTRAYC